MSTAVPQDYAVRTRALRAQRGLSQTALAALLNISNVTVNRWERGRSRPTSALWQALLRLESGEGSARTTDTPTSPPETASPPTDRPVRTGLPEPVTSFVGRGIELAMVCMLLDQHRLVTLTGPGGCGKTRLALAASRALQSGCAGGVSFVDLAAVERGELVPQAIAAAVGVLEQPGERLLETLRARLEARTLLLVLDNCEHLVAACAMAVRSLLNGCPLLRVLATSREPLCLSGEALLPVPPLSLPAASATLSIEEATRAEAVQLFEQRARLRLPSFVLTPATVGPVVEICRRLDGLPLALELAAARLHVLSPTELAGLLEQRFNLLVTGSRDAPPRHQTLGAAIDWSYALLEEPEQRLFRAVSVFAAGFTLTATTAIAGSAFPGGSTVVLDLLGSLVDKSMVVPVSAPDEGQRFRLLETMREYGRARLRESDPADAEALGARFAAYFLDVARVARRRYDTPARPAVLDALDASHPDLRAALGWYAERGEEEDCLRLAGALWVFWWLRGYWSEGRGWLDRALAPRRPVSNRVRARALVGSGTIAKEQGDFAAATSALELALEQSQEADDQRGMAEALTGLGRVVEDRDGYAEARPFHQQALALYRAAGDAAAVARTTSNLGLSAMTAGDLNGARARFEESLAALRQLGDRTGMSAPLNNLGLIAETRGDLRRARQYYAEALRLTRELGHVRGVALTLSNLGNVQRASGNVKAALPLLEQALKLAWELGDRAVHVRAMVTLGLTVAMQGEFDRATTLFADSMSLARVLGAPVFIAMAALGQGYVAAARREVAIAERYFSEAVDALAPAPRHAELEGILFYWGQAAAAAGSAERALALFEESRQRSVDAGQTLFRPLAMVEEGKMHRRVGNHLAADAALRAALPLLRAQGNAEGVAGCLDGLAFLALDAGRAGRAATVLAYTAARREVLGLAVHFPWQDHEPAWQELGVALDVEALERARASGRALSEEGAATLAMQVLPDSAAAVRAFSTATHAASAGTAITTRERDVLRLLMEGASNRLIAGNLVLSVRTVERHITHLYGKLGVTNRVEAANYARRHPLVQSSSLNAMTGTSVPCSKTCNEL